METGKPAGKVYNEAMKQAAATEEHFDARQATCGPRDKKQADNIKYHVNRGRRVHQDEIMAIYEMARKKIFGNFIREFKLIGEEAIVVADDSAIELTNSLLREARDESKRLPLSLGVDTTFNVGDCFCTPLVSRNCFLKKDPIYPVAFLLHETKEGDTHRVLLQTMKKYLPLDDIPALVPFVSDREGGICVAIQEELQSARAKDNDKSLTACPSKVNHVLCVVHIKRDVEHWIKTKHVPHLDLMVLMEQLDDLVKCETVEEFNEMYELYELKWTQLYKEYMKKHIRQDLHRAARFYTKQFPAFENVPATTNFVERLHGEIKAGLPKIGKRYDEVIIHLLNLQLNYSGDFHRAFSTAGLGNHIPKPQYAKKGPRFKLPSYTYWRPEDFIKKFEENYPPQEIPKLPPVTGNRALARIACDMGLVSMNPHIITYTVTEPYSDRREVVEERDGGRLECTCDDPGLCMHKEAYLRVTKKEYEGRITKYKLSEIRRNTRKVKGPSGRKPRSKKKNFEYDNLQGADDCDLAKQVAEKKKEMPVDNNDLSDDLLEDAEIFDADLHNATPPMAVILTQETSKHAESFVAGPHIETPHIDSTTMAVTSAQDTSQTVADVDDDELDDERGLHHYSYKEYQKSMSKSGGSTTTTIFYAGLETTPAEFQLPNEPPQINARLYRSRFQSLLPNEELSTDVVDNQVALLIKIHNMEDQIAFASTMDFYNAVDNTVDSLRRLLSWAMRSEAINSDIVMVPIHVKQPGHFMLGIIFWQTREVIIINSLPTCPPDLTPSFQALLKMAEACSLVSEAPFCPTDWVFVCETEAAIQNDSTSCGVWCIVNALSVCARKPFLSHYKAPPVDTIRAWIVMCLNHKDLKADTILLREGKRVNKLAPTERLSLATILARSVAPVMDFEHKSCWNDIALLLRGANYINNKCNSSDCSSEKFQNAVDSVMCCACRRWFHGGTCANYSKNIIFYFCPKCFGKKVTKITKEFAGQQL